MALTARRVSSVVGFRLPALASFREQPRRHLSLPGDSSVAGITVAIEGALRERRTDDAIRAFDSLRRKGSFPSRDCISTLVAQLAYKQTPSSLSQADKLVQEIVSMSRTDLLDQNSLSLLALSYAGVGMSAFARATLKFMFQTKLYPSVKVWVAVVSKIAEKRDDAPAALDLFNEICKITSGLVQLPTKGNADETSSLSRATTQDAEDPVARIMRLMDHAMTLKEDNSLLVQMKPDQAAFNAALKICAKLGMVKEAEGIFESMKSYSVSPDNTTFDMLIKVYGRSGKFDVLRSIPERMQAASVKPTGSTLKALLDVYIECGLEEAESLLQRTIGPNSDSVWQLLKLDNDIYNNLLKAYVSKRRLFDAANLLASLPEEGSGNGISQGKVVWSMIASGLLTEIYAIIQHMCLHNMPLHFASYRSIIQGFASNNQLDKAAGVMILMKRAAIKPDASCYGPVIQGLVRCGDKLLACQTFQEMVEARIPADETIYIPLLKSLMVECQASRMLKVMYGLLDFNARPTLYAWNLVIEALSRRHMVADAKRLLGRMEPSGVSPDSYTFWYVVKGLITSSRLVEVLDIWPLIQKAMKRNGSAPQMHLHKELVDTLLYAFVKGAYFAQALEVLDYAQAEGIPLDKEAFRDLFLKYHSHRFTSKHRSSLRVYRRQQQVEEMEQFKKWLQLAPIKIPARYSGIRKIGD